MYHHTHTHYILLSLPPSLNYIPRSDNNKGPVQQSKFIWIYIYPSSREFCSSLGSWLMREKRDNSFIFERQPSIQTPLSLSPSLSLSLSLLCESSRSCKDEEKVFPLLHSFSECL